MKLTAALVFVTISALVTGGATAATELTPTLAALVESCVVGAFGGAMYAALGYSRARRDEPFIWTRFVSTMVLGAAIGGALMFSGLPVTEGAIETRVTAMTGMVVLIEEVLKLVAEESERRANAEDD